MNRTRAVAVRIQAVLAPSTAASAAKLAPGKSVRGSTRDRKFTILLVFIEGSLQGVVAGFAGADADGLLQRRHEDLAVANLSCVRCLADCLDRLVHNIVGDGDFDLGLGQEVDDV